MREISHPDGPIRTRPFSAILDEFFWPNDERQNFFDLGKLERLLDQDWMSLRNTWFSGSDQQQEMKRFGPWTEKAITEVDVLTTSERKWTVASDIVRRAGLIPNQRPLGEDETEIHKRVRELSSSSTHYSLFVADEKQPSTENRTVPIPMLTMDTINQIHGWSEPIEKPTDLQAAVEMLTRMSDKLITTTTGIVARIPIQSNRWGRWVKLFIQIDVTYQMRHLSQRTIAAYIARSPHVLDVAGGLDLSSRETRAHSVDPTVSPVISILDVFGQRKTRAFRAQDITDEAINPYFAGAPPRPLEHLVFLIPKMYAEF